MKQSILTFLGFILCTAALEALDDPELDVEVQYLSTGLSNYVGVKCSWTGPPCVQVDQLEIFGDDGAGGSLAYVDENGPVLNIPNQPKIKLDGDIVCTDSECKANIDLKWKPYPITWADPSFKKFGCRVRGVRGGAPVVVEKAYNYRVREETENEVIDGRVTSDKIYFLARGGLNGEGKIRYFFLRCSAKLGIEADVTSVGIYKPDGTLLKGISVNGDLDSETEPNLNFRSNLNCQLDDHKCHRNEQAFVGGIWNRIDLEQDLGTTDDFYRLYCKVRTEQGMNVVTHSQYRTIRVNGGRQDIELH